jgi:nickel transport system substrate-binding protein
MAGEFDITVNDTYGFPQDPQVFLAAMLDYAVDYPAQQGLAQKPEIDAQITVMLNTTDEAVIQQAYTYVLTTLQDEAVNVPTTNIREMAVFNSEKIKSVHFSDDPTCCDVCGIVLK